MNNFYLEIKEIQGKDCDASLSKVIVRYSPVFLSMYSKYSPSIVKSGADPNDILSDKNLIIYESAKSFNLDKGSSFCTWLSNNVKYKCLHLMGKSAKINRLTEKVRQNTFEPEEGNPYLNKEMS